MLRRTRSLLFSLAFASLPAFSAIPASAASSTWSLRAPVQLQYFSDSDSDYHVLSELSTDNNPITNGISVVGNALDSNGGSNLAFQLTGEQYDAANPATTGDNRGFRAISIEDGILNQPYNNAVDRIATNFNFEILLSGGTVDFYFAGSDYSLLDASDNYLQGVGSSGFSQTYTAGDSGVNFAYLDSFGGSNADQGAHIVGDFVLNFTWTGYSANDTLEFLLPDTGITIQQVSIPEPASLSLLAIPSLLTLRRRHGA